MKNDSNLAVIPMYKDGDDDGSDNETFQILIDTADNGFVLTVLGAEPKTKVFLFQAKGEDGPAGLIQSIIDSLGINDKVKLEK